MYFLRLIKNSLFASIYLLLGICGFYACASRGTPSGGERDFTPPEMVGSKPVRSATNFDGKRIELLFDEYISIQKPGEKVIITPPQLKNPIIKAIGRKITVELKDSLLPNTTYTFDFTDGIVDNNEQNPIDGFSFAFSTGEVIDSMIISGILLNAENLEPMPNIMVGLHVDLADSAFTSKPFLRTSKTNDRGRFWIRNVAPGTYRLFALNDMNRDYKFDQPGEAIAFHDSLIVPSFEPAVRMDTIWKDSLTVDSIREIHYNRFIPDDITLFLFQEAFNRQYFSKSERPSKQQFILHFNSDQALPPDIQLLNENPKTDWYLPEFSSDKKSITYWLTDSLIYKQDTLKIEMKYMATDSLNNLASFTDTLQLIAKKKEAPKKKKKEEEKIDFLTMQITPSGTMEVYDTLKITFSEPVMELDTNLIVFEHKVDTLWVRQNVPIIQDDLNPRLFYLIHPLPYGQEYQLSIDSAAIYSIYQKWNNSTNVKLKTQKEEEYGNLYIKISGNEHDGFGQLLNSSDKVVRESFIQEGELAFEDLKPGKYYLRYIDDVNGNGLWDTGNYEEQQQPERVYYYPGSIEIPKFWDIEFEKAWNVKEIPIEKQKLLEITKNKPVEKKSKKDEEKSNQRNSNQRNSNQRNSNQRNSTPMSGGTGTRTMQRL
jgi:uncharacterized protein (DUF2141 family)